MDGTGYTEWEREAEIQRIDKVARLLDARFRIFGIRVGYDSLLGLVPGIGDTLALGPSAWIVWRAVKMGVPNNVIGRMAMNTGVDYVIGLVPIVGDLFDVGFKGNLRNARLLKEHLERGRSVQAPNQPSSVGPR